MNIQFLHLNLSEKYFFLFVQVKETQHTLRDSESGLHRMAIGHHLGNYTKPFLQLVL